MPLRRVCTLLFATLTASAVLFLPLIVSAQGMGMEDIGKALGNSILYGLAWFFQILVAALVWLLYLAGAVFDYTLNFTIYANYGGMEAINAGWTLLRDLINLVFIFLLLYVAINTILNADNTGWRKQVVQIVVAAILINFSLFITGIIIDAGNILAVQFYEQVTECDPGIEGCPDNGSRDIAVSFMYGLGLQEQFGDNAFGEVNSDAPGHSLRNSLIRLVFISAALWAFISVALLFVVRTIVLFILLVTAPIGIAGTNIPLINNQAKDWRRSLFQQTFVPVIFLFFVFLIIAFINETGVFSDPSGGALTGGSDTNPDTGGSLTAEDFFTTILLVAFIIAAVRITKNMSGKAGQMIDGFGKAAVGFGVGVATGGAAVAARGTVGAAASRLKESEELKNRAARGNVLARATLGTADSASKASFDPRSTKLAQFAGKKTGVNFGQAGGKGGYEKSVETAAKRKEEFADLLGEDKAAADAIQPDIDSSQTQLETLRGDISTMREQKASGAAIDEAELERKQSEQRQIQKRLGQLQEAQKAAKTKRQRRYAESLEKDTWWKRVRDADSLGKTSHVDKRAAGAIRKKIGQSNDDQFLEELSARLKGGKGEGGEEGSA